MERRLDELWMKAVELQVDRLVVGYLRKSHADYQNMQKRQWDLLDQWIFVIAISVPAPPCAW